MDKSNHTIEKLRKAAEKVEFEDERHIELRMELVWHVDKGGSLIKEKDDLINQLETKVQDLEEEKHRSEAHCCKAMQDMDCMRVDIWSLVAKVEMEENHALMEMQDLDSERQIKEFMGLLASKEQKLQKLIFAINKVKEEKKTKQEQDGKHGETSGRGERYDSVYEENMRRLIDEVSKHKMILLSTRRTKEKL